MDPSAPRPFRWIVRRHLAVAIAMASVVTAAGATCGARVAGGSDSYGYVSQADLWLSGHLHIHQDFGAQVPWPVARWTFTPLGYRPVRDGWAIVPQYSPGLPVLMAAAKAVAGQIAMFQIVPVSGGLLVLATYLIGRRLGRPVVGLAAAALVASSPPVIYMTMWPMSDVPAAAFWALAVASALRESRAAATASGLSAAMAILIRPNLVPIAGLIALWIGARDLAAGRWRRPASLLLPWFSVCAGAGAAFIGLLNTRLYGSPFESGYVRVSEMYAWSNVPANARLYLGWLIGSDSPLALAGVIALAVPAARLWPGAQARRAHWMLAGCAVAVWCSYLVFAPFDAWWYLRYLLPSWPMMAVGTASLVALAVRPGRPWTGWAAAAVVVGLGAHGVTRAVQEHAFGVAAGEFKFAQVARVVRSLTPRDAVIFSELHSGSLRYYGGRMTIRWDLMEPDWVDRAVDWLASHGHHPYLLLENDEAERFTGRYGHASEVARLGWAPIVSFRGGSIKLYDASHRDFMGPVTASPDPSATGASPSPVGWRGPEGFSTGKQPPP
jgi:hypothetical protein